MNSRIFTLCFVSVLAVSCQIKTTHSDDSTTKPLVDPKYSIAKDRAELEQMREEIPAEVKKKNDETALRDDWMRELKYSPEVIREKMSTLVRKKRDLFNKDLGKKREQFNKVERKAREEFLKNLEKERKDFLGQKVDREKRAEFFEEQDEKRREYFSEQKDKREDFEADMREERKDYEDYVKEKNDEFNSEIKAYTIKWNVKQKSQEAN
ncbi:MAG: hypothetical protein H7328_13365 [Bdellovibrio sp.]|nr:hypothetical protein [Bdellovibrio sp.]